MVKPFGYPQNLQGNQKTLKEFPKPSGNLQNPEGCCWKMVWMTLFEFLMMIQKS